MHLGALWGCFGGTTRGYGFVHKRTETPSHIRIQMNIIDLLYVDLVFLRVLLFLNKNDLLSVMVLSSELRAVIQDRHSKVIGKFIHASVFLSPLINYWGTLSRDVCDNAYYQYLHPIKGTTMIAAKRILHLLGSCIGNDHNLAFYIFKSRITKHVFQNVDKKKLRNEYIFYTVKNRLRNEPWAYLFQELTGSDGKRSCCIRAFKCKH
jgi:hypothetical protein